MAKISDWIREFIDDEDLYPRHIAELRRIADRIDSEMVELPKDADGVPIHVGDTVYLDDGRMACVTEIDIERECESIDCWDGSKHVAYHPSGITHERPDNWWLIADELEAAKGWRDQNGEYNRNVSSVSTKTLGDWADRIRKLANKEGQ